MQVALTGATVHLFNHEGNHAQQKNHKLHLIASENAPVGHVAIAGEAPDGSVVARGFYPAKKSADVLTSDVAGVVKDDIDLYNAAVAGKDGVAMETLSVTQAQHDAALNFMNGFANSNPYNLYRNSCVTAALQSLNAAGVSAFKTDTFGATPHAIYKAIDLGMQAPRP